MLTLLNRTPMIAGGLFTVNKTTFERLGKYDNAMDIWVSFSIQLKFNNFVIVINY